MQFRDLGKQYQVLKPAIDAQITKVIEQGQFILGPQVGELEKALADYVGVKHCVSCANGTDALQLVLMAWGVGPGDVVFTSDFTYFASAGTASIVGAHVELVDIDPRTFNMSPLALEKQINKVLSEGKFTPKVIVPVDLFGLPADYSALEAIAEKYGLKLLEDGAQGFGGSIDGKLACAFGDAATTSFFPAKPLGCYGDGGAIFTNDSELDSLLRSLRTQGASRTDKYDNRLIGMNSRLDTLQAGILLPKLQALIDYELNDVNLVADKYTAALKDVVVTPLIPKGYYSSWAQYSILLKDETQRTAVQQALKAEGIPSMIYYPRGIHQQTAYLAINYQASDYPVTVETTKRILALPMHPYLTDEEITKITTIIRQTIQG